jgi:hypothetical protein
VLVPLVLFALTNIAIYLVYLPWPNWTFTRFLLPALPVMVVIAVSTARRATRSAPIVCAVLALIVIGWQMAYAQRSELHIQHEAFTRFKTLPEELRRRGLLAEPIISRIHSGSLRHYAGITAHRWDVMSAQELRRGITMAIAAGERPLLIDDSDDRADFEQRFGPLSCWADVAAPLIRIETHAEVRVLAAAPGCAAP